LLDLRYLYLLSRWSDQQRNQEEVMIKLGRSFAPPKIKKGRGVQKQNNEIVELMIMDLIEQGVIGTETIETIEEILMERVNAQFSE
jgi:hypothetical protein